MSTMPEISGHARSSGAVGSPVAHLAYRSSSTTTDDDVDAPQDDRGQNETGGVIGMTFNTITNVIGGGVLDLPNAMYQASIAVGIVLMIFSSAASTYSVYILVKACDFYGRFSMMDIWALALFPQAPHSEIVAAVHRKRELLDNHTEDAELDAFLFREEHNHKWRGWMSDLMVVIMFLYNFGCLVLYGVVIGDSLPPVVHNFFGGSGLWTAKGTWLIGAGVIFFAFSCVRKMSELKWTSVIGFVTILYVIVVVVIRYFTLRAHPEDMPAFDEDTGTIDIASFRIGLASAMTTFGLAYTYHYNVPYYYKELHNRTTKKMMLTAAFSQPVTFVSYLLTGLFGYLTFGAAVDNDHSGGNIVDNYADDDALVNVGRVGLFFHFVCVYPILSVACRRGLHHLVMAHIVLPFRRRQRHLQHHQHPHERTAINQQDTVPGPHHLTHAEHTPQQKHPPIKLSMLESPPIDDDPTLPIIALEALVIVTGSITCAWVAPGIKIVVNVTGSLFGLFMMLIAPGIIGVKMFQRTRTCTTGEFHPPTETKKYYLSWALLVGGVVFMGSSFYTIVA